MMDMECLMQRFKTLLVSLPLIIKYCIVIKKEKKHHKKGNKHHGVLDKTIQNKKAFNSYQVQYSEPPGKRNHKRNHNGIGPGA